MQEQTNKKVDFNLFMSTVGLLFSGFKDEQVKSMQKISVTLKQP